LAGGSVEVVDGGTAEVPLLVVPSAVGLDALVDGEVMLGSPGGAVAVLAGAVCPSSVQSGPQPVPRIFAVSWLSSPTNFSESDAVGCDPDGRVGMRARS